jgi:Tfp pilus assembly protein PilV
MVRTGFSLLEVVISTTILVAASFTLLHLLTIGHEHQVRGERRATAQSLCLTLLDEQHAGIREIKSVDRQGFPENPDWEFSIAELSTMVPGVVRVRVRVWEKQEDDSRRRSDKVAFELVRWLRKPRGDRQ